VHQKEMGRERTIVNETLRGLPEKDTIPGRIVCSKRAQQTKARIFMGLVGGGYQRKTRLKKGKKKLEEGKGSFVTYSLTHRGNDPTKGLEKWR